jgi:hypothetical protein
MFALLVVRNIEGYKKEESDYLLKFLYDHLSQGADFQLRVSWEERTVVLWDVSTEYAPSLSSQRATCLLKWKFPEY